jgi:hypothetical protein
VQRKGVIDYDGERPTGLDRGRDEVLVRIETGKAKHEEIWSYRTTAGKAAQLGADSVEGEGLVSSITSRFHVSKESQNDQSS